LSGWTAWAGSPRSDANIVVRTSSPANTAALRWRRGTANAHSAPATVAKKTFACSPSCRTKPALNASALPSSRPSHGTRMSRRKIACRSSQRASFAGRIAIEGIARERTRLGASTTVIARLRRLLSDQLSRPSGLAGRVVAAGMNRGNRAFNEQAIARLDVHPGARVLDLGFGGGLTFGPLLERGATVVGADRAQDMVAAAAARHRADVDAGRLSLHAGEMQALPLADGSVDRVLTVNTVYFWPDLAPALREVHRVLAPGGRVVIGIRDGSVMERVDPAVFTLRPPDEIAVALGSAGFGDAEVGSAPEGKSHLISATR
jgi:arsenite methyltransferase